MRPAIHKHPRVHSLWSRLQIETATNVHVGGLLSAFDRLAHTSRHAIRRFRAAYAAAGRAYQARRTQGRITVDILPLAPAQVQVAVTRAYDRPEVVAAEEALLSEIARLWPGAIIHRQPSKRLAAAQTLPGHWPGGPVGTPEAQRIQIEEG